MPGKVLKLSMAPEYGAPPSALGARSLLGECGESGASRMSHRSIPRPDEPAGEMLAA
jgi:hypothetical protein